jgi:hypothetical protein
MAIKTSEVDYFGGLVYAGVFSWGTIAQAGEVSMGDYP